MEKICILMSTYNGEKYLSEQLDSILNQEKVEVDILIRDDGSTDNTLKILENYSEKFKNVEYYIGKNIKSAKSFMDLVKHSKTYKYYAFADQDDVWDRDKLFIGVSKLKEGYNLYGCKKRSVDKNLNLITENDYEHKHFVLGSVILRGYIAGCTMVFDDYLKNKVLESSIERFQMHDTWFLRVAFCVGKVYFDKVAHMSYRQHDNNVYGGKISIFTRWKQRIKFLDRRKYQNETRLIMAKELYNRYSESLSKEDKESLFYFAYYRENLKNRIKLVSRDFLHGDNIFDTSIIKILALLGIL